MPSISYFKFGLLRQECSRLLYVGLVWQRSQLVNYGKRLLFFVI